MKNNRSFFLVLLLGIFLMTFLSCATVGNKFPSRDIKSNIQIGTTTKDDIKAAFGSPWRKGIEDGNESWTYGYYRYKLIGQAQTKDLVVRFDDKGIVTSYSFNESSGGGNTN